MTVYIRNWSYLAKLNLKNIVSEDREEMEMGGRKKGKKEASCQSAEPLKCLDWHRDLWVFSRLFRWVQPCLQSMAPGLHLLFCPNLGKRGFSHWPLCPSYDPAHCGFFYLSLGSRLPTGPFSTFISALWGTWALLLSLLYLTELMGNKGYSSAHNRAFYLPPIILLLR